MGLEARVGGQCFRAGIFDRSSQSRPKLSVKMKPVNSIKSTTVLRRAIERGCVAMPGAFNAAAASWSAKAGFSAVYVSGAGLANATAGVPDIGLLSLPEVVQLSAYIADAVRIPALVDADTGFGGPFNIAKAVSGFERAGLAGMHLEDQAFPKRCGHVAGKTVVDSTEMIERIRAAVSERR